MSHWRVEITSPGELDVSEFTAAGNKLSVVPNFYGKGTLANAGIIRVYDAEGKVITTSLLTVSGISGTPQIRSVAHQAPARERKKAKP